MVKRDAPGLILPDMKMPVMDGWRFARKRAEEVGAVGWIGKPFDLDALVEMVGRHVRAG